MQVVVAMEKTAKSGIFSAPIEPASDSTKAAEDLSEEEFEACLDSLAAGLDELPVLPPQSISRESIYGDG